MSGVTISLNSAEFRQAMREYAAVTQKDCAETANRTLNNFFIQGAGKAKEARRSDIDALTGKPWWPKLIAARMRNQAGAEAASKIFQAQWAKAEMPKHVKGAFRLDKGERSYARYAKQLSRRIITARTHAVRFLMFFFVTGSQKLAGYVPAGKKATAGKTFAGFSAVVSPATSAKPNASVTISYPFKYRGSKVVAGVERKIAELIPESISATVKDMRVYIDRQLAKRAQQFSGRPS